MIDLIILALLSYFIIRKLKSILGEESDIEHFGYYSTKETSNIKDAEKVHDDASTDDISFDYLSDDAKRNLKAIIKRNDNFSLSKFQTIAEKVVEYVLQANNERNTKDIKKFLSPHLSELILDAFKNKEQNRIFLVSIKKTKVLDIIKTEEKFDIKMQFNMEQINYTENAQGEIIDGNKNTIISVQEIWTFTHDFNNKNSSWLVSEINEL